jgi:hypothetical protein
MRVLDILSDGHVSLKELYLEFVDIPILSNMLFEHLFEFNASKAIRLLIRDDDADVILDDQNRISCILSSCQSMASVNWKTLPDIIIDISDIGYISLKKMGLGHPE